MEKMEAESLAELVRMAGRVGIEGPDEAITD
jgi:FixJ family two-component response regulator